MGKNKENKENSEFIKENYVQNSGEFKEGPGPTDPTLSSWGGGE